MRLSLLCAAIIFCLTIHSVYAGDWSGFRGPAGDGKTADTAPTKWSAEENIAWKAPMPWAGNGSPIVAGNQVLVTSVKTDEGKQRSLFSYDRKTGQQQWEKTVEIDEAMPHHKTNPHGSSTPASDGKSIVVWHASAGLYCYDMAGNQLWSRDLGEYRHMWGYGSSPIIRGDKVLLHTGPGKTCTVVALNLSDGKTLWRHDEPLEGTYERREDDAPQGSWSTPVFATVAGREQAIVMFPKRVVSFDVESGDIVWSCNGLRHDRGDLAYSSPVIAGDLCFVTGGYKGPGMAIRLDGKGDVTQSHRLWRNENNPQSIGSGVFVDGYVYRPNGSAGKGIECIDPKTGDALWSQRTSGPHWGSMVMSGDLLYVTAQDGTTVVFKPSPGGYDEVSENQLGETCNGTPAISDGQIFIRTDDYLYCIGS